MLVVLRWGAAGLCRVHGSAGWCCAPQKAHICGSVPRLPLKQHRGRSAGAELWVHSAFISRLHVAVPLSHRSRKRKRLVCPEQRCELQPPRCPQGMGSSSCSLLEDSSRPEECLEIPASAPGDGLSGSVALSPALLQPTGLDADPGSAGLHFAALRAQQAALSSHPWLSTAPLCAQRSSCCFMLKPSPAGREAPLSHSFLSECPDTLPFPLLSPGVEEVLPGRPEDDVQPWQGGMEQQAVLSGGGQPRASQHGPSRTPAPKGPKDSPPCTRKRKSGMATDRLQHEAAFSKEEKSRGGAAGASRSWRVPAARREKLAGLAGTASPSQVAMASFAPRRQGGLPVPHRIQVCGSRGEQGQQWGPSWCGLRCRHRLSAVGALGAGVTAAWLCGWDGLVSVVQLGWVGVHCAAGMGWCPLCSWDGLVSVLQWCC